LQHVTVARRHHDRLSTVWRVAPISPGAGLRTPVRTPTTSNIRSGTVTDLSAVMLRDLAGASPRSSRTC
jgi:hypothetical protein